MHKLEIHHLDVGQGDCCLIIVRNLNDEILRTVVIDCGGTKSGASDNQAADTLLESCLHYGVMHIDVVVITHYDEDHFGGILDLLERAIKNPEIRGLFQNTLFYDRGEIRWYYPGTQTGSQSSTRNNIRTTPPRFRRFSDSGGLDNREESEEYLKYVESLYRLRNLRNGPANLLRITELVRGFPRGGGEYALSATQFTTVPNPNWKAIENYTFWEPYAHLGNDLLNTRFVGREIADISLTVVVVNRHRIGEQVGDIVPMAEMSAGENNSSICLLLKMGNFTYWFPGELSWKGEKECVESLAALGVERLTGMKLAHHGSDKSTSASFMDSLQPKFTVVSCGPDSWHGHPGPQVVDFLYNAEYVKHVFCTGYGGPVDHRIPMDNAPFDMQQKFQLAGSSFLRLRGDISITTDSAQAHLNDPQFVVICHGQNFWYRYEEVAEIDPNDEYDFNDQSRESFDYNEWDPEQEYFRADLLLDPNGEPHYNNYEINEATSMITRYHFTTNGPRLLGRFHLESEYVAYPYPAST